MPSTRQCAKCGLDLTDRPGLTCPACGTKIVTLPGTRIWWAALFQIAVSTIFMLIVGFPKIMIATFGIFILTGAALSARLKQRQLAAALAPQRKIANPSRFRILSLGV